MPENNEKDVVKENASTFCLLREIWEWFYTIIIALAIALCIKAFLFDVVRVDGPSMYPTLVNNDRLIVTKLGYEPDYGDIVILDSAYKNRMAYYDDYEEENGKELSWFNKIGLYRKMPKEYRRKYYVKRIIGMAGDVIDLKDGKVLRNGEVIDEPYYTGETGITDPKTVYPFEVSEGNVFVMGDNRPNSKDSRATALGEVPVEAVAGKARLRVWPIKSIGKLK